MEGSNLNEIIKIALPDNIFGQIFFDILIFVGLCDKNDLDFNNRLFFKKNMNGICAYIVNPLDVATYVERGAADIGVVGSDVLAEYESPVLELLDLKLRKPNMAVISKKDFEDNVGATLRVATKYPNIAMNYFLKQSRDASIIKVQDFPEMSLYIGMADVVIDVIDSDYALKKINLAVYDHIFSVIYYLVANRSSYHFKNSIILNIVNKLKDYIDNSTY